MKTLIALVFRYELAALNTILVNGSYSSKYDSTHYILEEHRFNFGLKATAQ